MNPLLDEHAHEVGRDVREFAKLHVDLARSEVRDGSTRLLWGLRLVVLATFAIVLAMLAGGVSLFLLLQPRLSAAGAAAVVALTYLLLAGLADGFGRRYSTGGRSLFLPRTRAMLRELMQWQEKPTDS